MSAPLKLLRALDATLERTPPDDFHSLSQTLRQRGDLLDQLAALSAAEVTPELLDALNHSADCGAMVRRKFLVLQHSLTQELAGLNLQHSFADAIQGQAPPVTTGLDCSG